MIIGSMSKLGSICRVLEMIEKMVMRFQEVMSRLISVNCPLKMKNQ